MKLTHTVELTRLQCVPRVLEEAWRAGPDANQSRLTAETEFLDVDIKREFGTGNASSSPLPIPAKLDAILR